MMLALAASAPVVVAMLLTVLACGMLATGRAIDRPAKAARISAAGWALLAAHRAPGLWRRLRDEIGWQAAGLLGVVLRVWDRLRPGSEPDVAAHDADMAARPQVTALADAPRPGRINKINSGEFTGPGRIIRAVPVQGAFLPLDEPADLGDVTVTHLWVPVAECAVPVRDRPALLRPWIADALGAPTVDAALTQIFGPRALAALS